MNHYDYIIAGGGAAGLSLIYHLGQANLLDRRVLVIDQVRKTQNDRTWCFWEVGSGPFEALVRRSWDHLWFHGRRSRRLSIAPYRYKLIQGGDFYQFMDAWLRRQSNVTRVQGRIAAIEERGDGVAVTVDGVVYTGCWAFSSIPTTAAPPPGYAAWLQHFKGWVITTPQPVFDPDAATFMDFRVAQGDHVRFVYVLPYDAHTALVEDTYFSPSLLPQAVYDSGLRGYIAEYLGLTSYAITHVEYGVIPMTDMPFSRRPSPHVMTIGTAGGMTKASTGYTFQRIQRQSRRIAASLGATGQPFYDQPMLNRHALMDSVLLNVLDTGRERGQMFFDQLFNHNRPQQVLRFLDEDSSLLEDLALMTTVNIPVFVTATLDVAAQRTMMALARRR
ncbi:MAG: lycopene cyclase [Oscillochloris sp.]|nr:lycopene cyclase [Oscillochloris sp.]